MGKFIRSLQIVGGASEHRGHACESERVAMVGGASRQQTITRLAVLKAIAELAVSRSDAKSGDVLAIAERWEAEGRPP